MNHLHNKYPVYEEVLDTHAENWDTNEEKSSPNAYHYILLQFYLCLLNVLGVAMGGGGKGFEGYGRPPPPLGQTNIADGHITLVKRNFRKGWKDSRGYKVFYNSFRFIWVRGSNF